ncbi:hypothetical protein LX32DRAFT_165296 [Colletotrichum zoysiae]|uniref:Uncharacterized protein n=1 Tax=Colletotrichum zoysiae TaxID=1216348 RepID=A0AAD9LYS8_9PEZI|nr:hypothetical protein LX32DRAFT_165296 [Colletotrichum zoysiae]
MTGMPAFSGSCPVSNLRPMIYRSRAGHTRAAPPPMADWALCMDGETLTEAVCPRDDATGTRRRRRQRRRPPPSLLSFSGSKVLQAASSWRHQLAIGIALITWVPVSGTTPPACPFAQPKFHPFIGGHGPDKPGLHRVMAAWVGVSANTYL